MSVLLYHFICPAKCRKVVFNNKVDHTLREVYLEIEKRYELHFLEIGTDKDRVHFLLQSVLVKMVKIIVARELFRLHSEIKKQLWSTHFDRPIPYNPKPFSFQNLSLQ
ncbi:transposase [Aquimarina sp. RZ0]|uniref:transposase n=1 Tax=Aquimarina sp. RZ0 TaxID=2607730 RepID=UPI0034CF90EF